MRIALLLAVPFLIANAPDTARELSFFERAELPEATLLNAQQLGEKMMNMYPSTPDRHNVKGTVVLSVVVTPDGRATDCQIKRTSGNAIIDRRACLGTERYARFTPSKNDDGDPIISQWTETFTLTFGNRETSDAQSAH